MPIDPGIVILLVEDSLVMRQAEIKILKELGFSNILEAGDGQLAMELLQTEEQVGLIISDWNMPNMDGYELLVWLRGDGDRGATPFMMATAQGEKRKITKALDAGADGVISKPFSPRELIDKMEMVFDPQRAEVGQEKSGVREIQLTEGGKVHLKVAHIQITDHLTLGVLKHKIESGEYKPRTFELETVKMPSWNPVQESMEAAEVDAVLALAPIAMDMFSAGVPLKLVLLAHKNGSIFVRSKKGDYKPGDGSFFKGRSFFIPHRLSIHHMLSHMFLSDLGLKPGVPGAEADIDVTFEVVPPIKMPEFLGNDESACGFMVAEPLGSKAIKAGLADLQLLSGRIWADHPCCVVCFREEVIAEHPEAVQEFCDLMVKSGRFIAQEPDIAAQIAVRFLDPDKNLGLVPEVLKKVLTEPDGITTHDLYPVKDDLERIQDYMMNSMGIGTGIDLDEFVDLRFAETACRIRTEETAEPEKAGEVVEEQVEAITPELEGKYLTFDLDGQEYGIEIMKVKEIIGLAPITPIPRAPAFVKGVINLRGKVIPVVDLRLKFGLAEEEYTERTCIIVLETEGEAGPLQVGVVVDAVSEVMYIKASDIEEPPRLGTGINTDTILGMAKIAGGVKTLLDIGQVIGKEGGLMREA